MIWLGISQFRFAGMGLAVGSDIAALILQSALFRSRFIPENRRHADPMQAKETVPFIAQKSISVYFTHFSSYLGFR